MSILNYNKAQYKSQLSIDINSVNFKRELSQIVDTYKRLKAAGLSDDQIHEKLSHKKDIYVLEIKTIETLKALSVLKEDSDFKKTSKISEKDRITIFNLGTDNLEVTDIARFIGCTPGLAKQIFREGYLNYRSLTSSDEEPFQEDWAAAESLFFLDQDIENISVRINKTTEKTKEMIEAIADAYQSKRKRNKTLWLDDKIILAFQHKRGRSLRQVASQLNCCAQTVANQLKAVEAGDYDPFRSHNEQKKRYRWERNPYKLESCEEFIKRLYCWSEKLR